MVSLELAKKLKDAGLRWELREGDCLSLLYNRGLPSEYRKLVYLNEDDIEEYEETNEEIWLPSLSQLLAEIEGRGYRWELNSPRKGIARLLPYKCYVNNHKELESKACWADSVEDAAAAALLWILEREKFETAETQKIEALDKLSSALRKAGVWNE